jgi:GAF domain-containing protein
LVAREVTGLRRAERQRARLQAVTAALSQARSASEVVDVVLSEGFAAMHADAAVVALPVAGSERLEVLGLRGYPGDVARRLAELTLDAPLPLAEALRTGRPVWLADPVDALRRYPATADFGLDRGTSAAALPLVVQGRAVGAWVCGSQGPRRSTTPTVSS